MFLFFQKLHACFNQLKMYWLLFKVCSVLHSSLFGANYAETKRVKKKRKKEYKITQT